MNTDIAAPTPRLDVLHASDGTQVLSERLIATCSEPQRRFLMRERILGDGYRIEFRELDAAPATWPPHADGFRPDENTLDLTVDHRLRTVRFGQNFFVLDENCHSLTLGTYMLARSIAWAQASGLGEYRGWGSLVAEQAAASVNRARRDRLYARQGFCVTADDRGSGRFEVDRIADLTPTWSATKLQPLSVGPCLDRLREAEDELRDRAGERKRMVESAADTRTWYAQRLRRLGKWRAALFIVIGGFVAVPDAAAGLRSVLLTVGSAFLGR